MEGVFCSNSEWGLKLAVETDRQKRVSIHAGSKILTTPRGRLPPVTYIWLGLRLETLTLA